MLILGISCFYHDAAAALIEDGKIIAAAQEERFSRIKHDENFPENAIRYCLKEAGIRLGQVDSIVFYEKPLLKFERILETFVNVAPRGLKSFLYAMPKWVNEKIFFKSLLKNKLKEIGDFDSKKIKLLFTEHHISHAASCYYPSGFDNAAILVVDGVGEWATISISKAEHNKIQLLKEIHFPHSIGMLYSAFTYFLGFKVNSGEYKLMGLSPYAQRGSEEVNQYKKIIYQSLIQSKGENGFQLNMEYFSFQHDLRMINDGQWEKLFDIKARKENDDINASHCNIALAIQEVTEELLIDIVQTVKQLIPSENICLSGGVALNCVANGKILNSKIFKNIFVASSPGDSGGAIGAALYAYHQYFEKPLDINIAKENQTAYLGPEASEEDIKILKRQYNAVFESIDTNTLIPQIAQYLSEGKVVGWMQGRMEFGPRALGNRSILALPSIADMQTKLNLKIKFREDFRPFAPVLKADKAQKYFKLPQTAHYMEYIVELQEDFKKPLPQNFNQLELKEKLHTPRSEFQAVIHTDYTARPQTVSVENNPILYQLLDEVEKISHHPILVNTSFNVRGEPIVCTALDAYACFMQTDIDILVINNHLFLKEKQDQTFIKQFKNRTFSKD
ncbi:MAG: carbamoyltransferase [Chitinophagales bacterium]|nr:carbamoyltransferase [Chitinophagales bacterium]